jgi:FkbH-like protein
MNLVRDYLPEVAVMPPELIKDYSGFQKSSVTKEDERRGEMYQEEKKREEFKTSFGNIDDYLKNLEIKIKVAEANSKNIPRVSQLTQKTNQFNVTTRRYSEDDIRNFIKNGSKIWTLEVWDRFGEYGLTGVCIVTFSKNVAKIDTFLLSCRVLGRGVEKAFLGFILEKIKNAALAGEKTEKIIGEFIPTKKNILCESFFRDNEFMLVKKEGETVFYEYNLNDHYQMSEFVTFI